jgi:hypothetical protein
VIDETSGTPEAKDEVEVIDAKLRLAMKQEYRNDPTSADRKWAGRRIQLESAVGEIGRDGAGFFLDLEEPFRVYPDPGELDGFGTVRTGDRIVVEGVVQAHEPRRTSLRIVLDRAKLLRAAKS